MILPQPSAIAGMDAMSEDREEARVTAIDYVGCHAVHSELYEIALTLAARSGGAERRLSLLLHPAEAALLAHMLQRNPPRAEAQDHVLDDIALLQT
jgi:hypothetical protein